MRHLASSAVTGTAGDPPWFREESVQPKIRIAGGKTRERGSTGYEGKTGFLWNLPKMMISFIDFHQVIV